MTKEAVNMYPFDHPEKGIMVSYDGLYICFYMGNLDSPNVRIKHSTSDQFDIETKYGGEITLMMDLLMFGCNFLDNRHIAYADILNELFIDTRKSLKSLSKKVSLRKRIVNLVHGDQLNDDNDVVCINIGNEVTLSYRNYNTKSDIWISLTEHTVNPRGLDNELIISKLLNNRVIAINEDTNYEPILNCCNMIREHINRGLNITHYKGIELGE